MDPIRRTLTRFGRSLGVDALTFAETTIGAVVSSRMDTGSAGRTFLISVLISAPSVPAPDLEASPCSIIVGVTHFSGAAVNSLIVFGSEDGVGSVCF